MQHCERFALYTSELTKSLISYEATLTRTQPVTPHVDGKISPAWLNALW